MAGELHSAKTQAILTLLRRHVGEDVAALEPLAGGLFSRAFGFASGGRKYVLRLSDAPHARASFEKDAFAGRCLRSPELPIPRVIALGAVGEGWFAISERAPGKPLSALPGAERRALLPALLDTLAAVGRAEISSTRGFGDWGADGHARHPSWRAFLASAIEDESEGYYRGWHRFFRESFLERELYEAVYRRMLELAAVCPEERALIHNDYQFENVLSDGARITGVIDWANALYGDPLYDVAWLVYISSHPGWWFDDGVALLDARFGHLPGYATRLACCKCHVGLDHLRFYARNARRADYELCKAWLLDVITA